MITTENMTDFELKVIYKSILSLNFGRYGTEERTEILSMRDVIREEFIKRNLKVLE